ncbi:hypothetical protein SUGI_0317160 [Cryptomeria japonica]|nr:hypothetical protein SUGI_0317160 [Cryptomeria japonica]
MISTGVIQDMDCMNVLNCLEDQYISSCTISVKWDDISAYPVENLSTSWSFAFKYIALQGLQKASLYSRAIALPHLPGTRLSPSRTFGYKPSTCSGAHPGRLPPFGQGCDRCCIGRFWIWITIDVKEDEYLNIDEFELGLLPLDCQKGSSFMAVLPIKFDFLQHYRKTFFCVLLHFNPAQWTQS